MIKKIAKVLIPILIIAAAVLGIVFGPDMFENLDSSLMISSHTASAPRLIAHRGLSSLYPENTLPAFEGAKEYGFDGFEFDVHTTKDGEWVVIHDDEVDHMTDGTGRVDSFTLEEILRLNIDNGNHIEEQGMKSVRLTIPTLSQTLDVCKDSDIVPVIEIKGCDVQYLPSLKQTLDEYGLSERAVIISFEEEYLEEYRKLDSDIEMLYLANTLTKEDVDWCIANDFGINYNCWLLYKNFSAVRYAEKNGVKIGAWTVDNTVFADVMVLFGAGYLTTNKILP
jgi:glycerophosphoryl diester phosphodiesterase